MVTRQTTARRAEQRKRLEALGIEQHEPKPGKRKYHNTPSTYNGVRYDSAGEAEYAHRLDIRLATGQILDWWRPPAITLIDAAKPRERITYKPDFAVLPVEGNVYYVDYKGSGVTETVASNSPTRASASRPAESPQ